MSVAEAAACAAEGDGFVWLGIHDPTEAGDERRRGVLPRARARGGGRAAPPTSGRRSRTYDNHYFVVLKTASYVGRDGGTSSSARSTSSPGPVTRSRCATARGASWLRRVRRLEVRARASRRRAGERGLGRPRPGRRRLLPRWWTASPTTSRTSRCGYSRARRTRRSGSTSSSARRSSSSGRFIRCLRPWRESSAAVDPERHRRDRRTTSGTSTTTSSSWHDEIGIAARAADQHPRGQSCGAGEFGRTRSAWSQNEATKNLTVVATIFLPLSGSSSASSG